MERPAPDPGPRAAWAFAVVALVLGVGFIVVIAFGGAEPHAASGPIGTSPPAQTHLPATPSPSPTAALAVTGNNPGGPVTTGDQVALRVEFPEDGEIVVSRHINVFGRAPAGALVLRELSDGSVVESVARGDGLWILGVDLDSRQQRAAVPRGRAGRSATRGPGPL